VDVAVIGAGNVGGTIGRALARGGHRVWFGSRHPDTVAATGTGTATTVGDAIVAAEIVVVAVPAGAMPDFLSEHGAALAGKLAVDAVNRIGGPGPANSAHLFAEHAPAARYARAFNSLGWENFEQPRFGDVTADLLFSSAEADQAAMEALIGAVGLNPVYLGPDQFDVLDSVVRLWFTLAVGRHGGRHLAFKVLHD
jgi:predicted dinucleotide-binding enzyme